MITREQVAQAKTIWEQARQSAVHANECWALLQQSRKALVDSFRTNGFPVSKAAQEFERLMEDHAERYTAAQTHMDNMSAAYGKLLEEFNKACS